MRKAFLIVLILTFFFSGCEKDDICDPATATTPKLIIEFYDNDDHTLLKNVTNLKVTGEGMTSFLLFNAESKIELPLKTLEDITKYSFIINSDNTDLDNEDLIQFNYARQNIFVSRACGFKTVFTLDATTPFVHSDTATPDGLWIQGITIITPNIENENETHIKIYF